MNLVFNYLVYLSLTDTIIGT